MTTKTPLRQENTPAKESGEAPEQKAAWFRYTEASSLGLEIMAAIVIGALGGYYLERYVTHWSPWTMMLGLLVGLGAAAQAVVRTVRAFNRRVAAEAAQESTSPASASPRGPRDGAPSLPPSTPPSPASANDGRHPPSKV